MFGIENYNPHFYEEANELYFDKNSIFISLIGQSILKVFWVWDKKNSSWFEDCPVVVELTKGYLSLCASKFSLFSVGWNELSLTEKIDWYGMDDFQLVWREYNENQLSYIIGKTIAKIKILNYQMRLHNSELNNELSCLNDSGFLHGIALQFDEGHLAITNGLDKNNIELFDKELPKYIISSFAV